MRARTLALALAILPLAHRGAGATVWTKTTACVKPAERDAARAALSAFGTLLENRGAKQDEVAKAWKGLLTEPCLVLPAKLVKLGTPTSVVQLATWWREGGEAFLRDYVSIGDRPSERKHELIVPVDARRTIGQAMAELDRRRSRTAKVPPALLCERPDELCDPDAAETVATFEAAARSEERLRRHGECGGGAAKRRKECLDSAHARPARLQLPSFVECMAGSEGKRAARYPLGGLRLPRTGWLILQGRRGHYQFCDEWRAYDLATGSAYIVSACGGLVLEPGGKVNGGATAKGLGWEYRVGRISPDAVRRITFLLATGALSETELAENATIEVPAGMGTVWWEADDQLCLSGVGSCGWFTSAQTAIGWTWRDGATILASGQLTWPDSDDAVDSDVAERLRIAEAAIVDGCALRALPRDFLDGAAVGGVSRLDRPEEGRPVIDDKLLRGLEAALRVPVCVPNDR